MKGHGERVELSYFLAALCLIRPRKQNSHPSCLQKFGEGGGYLLFIFRGQRSDATILQV